MISIDARDYFLEFSGEEGVEEFLAPMVRLRGSIVLDPMLADPWTCDPARCRPVMGRNLCCKVDTRCRHFTGELCSIHETKPFSCLLFPIDLWRVGPLRAVISAKNPIPYERDWTRFDRDMLRCFEGVVAEGGPSMLEVQLPVLSRVFTQAELSMMHAAVERLRDAAEI